jgi:UDP-glucose 4-epimerase
MSLTRAHHRTDAKSCVLVCGGAGYIGSVVVRDLLAAGRTPVVLDDLSTGHRQAVPDGVRFVRARIGDRRALDTLFRAFDVDCVIHLCAHAYVHESVVEPARYYRNNVAESLTLLEAMLSHDVRRIVFSSSCAVYGEPAGGALREDCPRAPISPYGHTKAIFEQILSDFERAYGLRWMALRYFNAAGALEGGEIGEDHSPETHLIPLVLRRALPGAPDDPVCIFGDDYDTPDGTCIRDYIHVLDLADAHIRAVEHLESDRSSLALNLANGKGFSVREVLRACEAVTGRRLPCRVQPRRPGDPSVLIGDASRAAQVLGWKPTYQELDDIVRTAWQWHRSHPKGYATTPREAAANQRRLSPQRRRRLLSPQAHITASD